MPAAGHSPLDYRFEYGCVVLVPESNEMVNVTHRWHTHIKTDTQRPLVCIKPQSYSTKPLHKTTPQDHSTAFKHLHTINPLSQCVSPSSSPLFSPASLLRCLILCLKAIPVLAQGTTAVLMASNAVTDFAYHGHPPTQPCEKDAPAAVPKRAYARFHKHSNS
jgi:hypothetical protein